MKRIPVRLGHFSRKEQEFLIALPFRVGWLIGTKVRKTETLRGAGDVAALEKAIVDIAGNVCLSPLVQELFEQTLANRHMWTFWQEEIDHTPSECRKALEILSQFSLCGNDADSFRQSLIEVANVMARAFHEFGFRKILADGLYVRVIEAFCRFRGETADHGEPFVFNRLKEAGHEGHAITKLAHVLNSTPPSAVNAV